jgi:Arc/MetJ family transcription regulator
VLVHVDADVVELLDAAWRKHGLHSRNGFVLRALGHELRELGEREPAERSPAAEV